MERYRNLALEFGADPDRLPEDLRRAFIALDLDPGTRDWIDRAFARPDPRLRTMLRNVLAWFVGFYDANGLAQVGEDRLLGTEQWRRLLGNGGARLLDVGAGDGAVTDERAPLFGEVCTTELSPPLARRLRAKGYACHRRDISFDACTDLGRFDVVALQNVIDRTTHPLQLLDRALCLLADGGRLVVPIPVRAVVFIDGLRFAPAEALPAEHANFESAVAALHAQVFAPRGLRVAALTRAPYLCRGDARSPVKRLDDAIFVLTRGSRDAAPDRAVPRGAAQDWHSASPAVKLPNVC